MDRRTQERKSKFKKGIDQNEWRRRREDQSVSIRKNKREEMVAKKRQLMDNRPTRGTVSLQGVEVAELVQTIRETNDHEVRLESLIQVRKLLSSENSPPIGEIVETGALPLFITYLEREEQPKLQFEAAWVLTNIASGNSAQTAAVVAAEAIPAFICLMSSNRDDLREQAAWALGNIAGDSAEKRDLILQAGALEPLLRCINNASQISATRNCSWTLSNFCRGKPAPPLSLIHPAINFLAFLLDRSNDEEILVDVCWALSYLTDGANERIESVVNQPGVVQRVVDLLDHPLPELQTPALRVIGNIVTGSEAQTQVVLESPLALPLLKKLLHHNNKATRKEACWGLSNIAAVCYFYFIFSFIFIFLFNSLCYFYFPFILCSDFFPLSSSLSLSSSQGAPYQIGKLIEADIVPSVLDLMEKCSEFEIRKEAIWTLSNMATCGSAEQLLGIISAYESVIVHFCFFLGCWDMTTVSVCLDALDNILRLGSDPDRFTPPNPYLLVIEGCGGYDQITDLSNHQSQVIHEKVARIMEYFEDFEDYFEPEVEEGAFQFGSGKLSEMDPSGGFQF